MNGMQRRHVVTKLGVAAALGLAVAACTTDWVADGSYPSYSPYTAPSASATTGRNPTTPPAQCFDATGFGGKGCYACPPKTNEELLTACTSSRYETFENESRIAGFNPMDPRPTLVLQGPTPPPFEGGAEGPAPPLPPAPPCPIATKPNPVMVLGATGLPLETIAKAMGSTATIFYLEKGSCEGVATMLLNDPKLEGEIVYYETDGSKHRCMLSERHPADIALSSLFAESCANQAGLGQVISLPVGVEDQLGPVNPVMFAVPATSTERAISAEAAYKVYGFGDGSGVAPWTDEEYVFRRRPSSGNQQTIARTLGLPADAFRGRDSNGSSNMLQALLTSPEPRRTIGISSSEIVDPNRDVMKTLAYRHYEQPVAFYPDSDPATLDRRNVRDGHYFMWLPLHVLSRTRGGEPVAVQNGVLDSDGAKSAERDTAVKRLVYVMVNRQPAPVPSVDLFGALKRSGNVPQCAMHVRRAKEGAPLEPYTPPLACDCAFEATAPGATPPTCQACEDSSDCPAAKPSCSFGFCE